MLAIAAGAERIQAELAALDKTTRVVTLDRLERAGLAGRRVSATDRRARVVVLSPPGSRCSRRRPAG